MEEENILYLEKRKRIQNKNNQQVEQGIFIYSFKAVVFRFFFEGTFEDDDLEYQSQMHWIVSFKINNTNVSVESAPFFSFRLNCDHTSSFSTSSLVVSTGFSCCSSRLAIE